MSERDPLEAILAGWDPGPGTENATVASLAERYPPDPALTDPYADEPAAAPERSAPPPAPLPAPAVPDPPTVDPAPQIRLGSVARPRRRGVRRLAFAAACLAGA